MSTEYLDNGKETEMNLSNNPQYGQLHEVREDDD